jgi:hypothetical protein
VKRLIETIVTGSGSRSVMAGITEREATLREVANQTVEPGPDSVQEKLDGSRAFAISRLDHLRNVLTDPKTIHGARALLAEQAGKFTLE